MPDEPKVLESAREGVSELKVPLNASNTALSVLTVLAVIVLLRYAQELFIPIVLAILIVYALDPVVALLQRLRIPRTLAAGLILIIITGITGFGCYALRRQAAEVLEMLPDAAQKVRLKIQQLRRTDSTSAITRIQQAANEIERAAAEATGGSKAVPRGVTKVQIEAPAFRASDYLWSGSTGLLGFLSQVVLVFFLVFFMLASGDLFKRKLIRVAGRKLSEKRVALQTLTEINGQIERFLLIQVLTGALVGAGTTVTLWAFGLSQPAVWGLAAGIFNSVPYVGAIIVTGGIAMIAFLQFGSLATTLQITGAVLAITSLEGFLLTPALMGKAARINGVAMFLGLLFWSWIWGVIGMIVAVPIMMVLKSICERVESLSPIAELLSE